MTVSMKKSFELQNKLERMACEAERYLADNEFMFRTTIHHYKSKANSEAVDEATQPAERQVGFTPTELIDFYVYLMNKKIEISDAIEDAKTGSNYTKHVNSNIVRRKILHTLQNIYSFKSRTFTDRRRAYKLNTDGEQVAYEYDADVVATIDFDRNAVKAIKNRVCQQANETSEIIDRCLASIEVEIQPLPFDADDTLEDAVQSFIKNR